MKSHTTESLAQVIRSGRTLSLKEQMRLTLQLSAPSILAQVSTLIMQYIDASMVGHLGAGEAASIGLVSTTIWLFSGLCMAVAMAFAVQVAHRVGAGDYAEARSVVRQSLTASLIFILLLAATGALLSGPLPRWLGGSPDITGDASRYFLIYALSLPALQANCLASGLLRCSGNMKVPGLMSLLMCLLNIIFNYLLIFPSHELSIVGLHFTLPGAGWGVSGAALGTTLAEAVTALLLFHYLLTRQEGLKLRGERGRFKPTRSCLRRALKIGLPMGCERMAMCGAQIVITIIVAPLGAIALAAHSFAIIAESLCYMPGYGISDAATALIGQSLGAGRLDLTRRFAYTSVSLGVIIMTAMGAVMYLFAPEMIGFMTPDSNIVAQGASVLRIEAFAEPMFAAAIVCYGVFIGTGSTLKPFLMNFGSIWVVRLPLAALLTARYGLVGVWIAMCAELCFRGLLFLTRLWRGKWLCGHKS